MQTLRSTKAESVVIRELSRSYSHVVATVPQLHWPAAVLAFLQVQLWLRAERLHLDLVTTLALRVPRLSASGASLPRAFGDSTCDRCGLEVGGSEVGRATFTRAIQTILQLRAPLRGLGFKGVKLCSSEVSLRDIERDFRSEELGREHGFVVRREDEHRFAAVEAALARVDLDPVCSLEWTKADTTLGRFCHTARRFGGKGRRVEGRATGVRGAGACQVRCKWCEDWFWE